MCSKVRELEAAGREIHDQLNQGAEAWNQAKVDFDISRQKMNEERKELEKRITLQHWIYYFLFFLLCLALGIALGKFCL
jgi:hypothetical protein